MPCIMLNFEINAQVCIYSVADLNIPYCLELTFLDRKLVRFLMLTFLKMKFFKI